MRGKKNDQENTVGTTKRVPVGFRCDECKRWYPRTERVIVNEGWYCPTHGGEAQDEFDRAWDRMVNRND
jgi:hypothetical protein